MTNLQGHESAVTSGGDSGGIAGVPPQRGADGVLQLALCDRLVHS